MNTPPPHPLKRLAAYSRQYRRRVILATICSILNKLFDLAPPVLIGAAVDVVVSQEDSFMAGLGFATVQRQLVALGIITLAIWALESLFEYLFSVLWRNLAQDIQHDLRLDTYTHVQTLDMAYFEERSTGGLMAILNDDINQLERFLDVGANDIIQLITTVIAIGGAFVVLAPSVAWMTILPMPFVIWGTLKFQQKLAPKYAAVREQVGFLNGFLGNNLSGIATVKSYTAEAYEVGRIREQSELYRQKNEAAIQLSSAFVPLIRMIIVLGFAAIMIFGGLLVVEGRLNVGVYSVLVFMTQRLLWPLTRLGQTLDLYQRAMASTNRVFDLLDTRPSIPDGLEPLPLADVRGEVAFEAVNFRYKWRDYEGYTDNQPHVIKELSLHIPAGETAAIVGPTGSGKSTLIKLLLRFYDVGEGKVCLDGRDIRTLHTHDLRRAIGLVSQDVFLFHGTVRENIAYGTFNATLDEIVEAAKVAEAHDFITQLPNGYDTIVGERGQKLSGGQRQRISIARAVLKDPPVLILDEATSSVDNETEAAIQRSMERISVGRTMIVIAHRLSTIRNADRIFVLENGALREQGTHDELVLQDAGIYAGLWRVQTGER
ncbi:MAG: ABC transporter ATP-binding protein [Chloroflexi bacterium]|nr:ABC transporter ATP-binding protein [Ardenticatenaceae bacterium]MBL1131196.1 ABC transporter ATP-binding protein [Chloroflexota bacterium]NOG37297.1 ABC transporter ATP-binding protein [Chloroflexota bacterium]GIK57018.1 MAG: ABC transporter [Chloroflexota bacterium]